MDVICVSLRHWLQSHGNMLCVYIAVHGILLLQDILKMEQKSEKRNGKCWYIFRCCLPQRDPVSHHRPIKKKEACIDIQKFKGFFLQQQRSGLLKESEGSIVVVTHHTCIPPDQTGRKGCGGTRVIYRQQPSSSGRPDSRTGHGHVGI